jgi:SNF2 family DNA or RNA helicase
MYKLFEHQKKGVELGKQGSKAFFWDCGCGKSCLMLRVIEYYKSIGIGPALVVCPLSIIDAAWIEDCKKFTPDLDIVSLWSKKPAERRKKLAEDHDIYVANFETFKGLWPEIQAKGFDILIVDESSKMKSPTTAITRALLAMGGISTRAKKGKSYKAGRAIPYRYVLSGTPAPNDESEYWSQCKFITGPGGEVFNDNFYAFRGKYFYSINLNPPLKMWKFRKNMQQEFQDNIAKIANVVAKEDAVDLPEQVYEIREVTLGDAERKAYDIMKKDLVLRFRDETVLASSALVEVMKLRQLSSGFCYGEDTHCTGTSKLKELKALLEEIGDRQVIIWANFKYEIRMIIEELGLHNCSALWSETPERDCEIRLFQDGTHKYLIANPQSAAHGLTFTNCNYAVYFSMNYSYELQKQSEDRIHRIGQNDKCTYFFLIAKNTVDKMIYNTVKNKGNLSKQTLDYLRGIE